MRKFFILLCAMLLTTQFAASQKNLYVVTKTGELYVYPAEKVSFGASLQDVPSDKDSLQDVPSDKDSLQDNTKIINGHKFIDLGLPSGLLWAETNIGAETAADDGNYYAWGETNPKHSTRYYWSSYKYGTSISNMTKYNSSDGKTTLDPEDDAACVNWGDSCRMPTDDEFGELLDSANCTWTWTSMTTSDGSSINGYQVTSVKNGNSIFLPVSCYIYYGNSYLGGYSWSRTLDSSHSGKAYGLDFHRSSHGQDSYYRCYGLPVRPVAEP